MIFVRLAGRVDSKDESVAFINFNRDILPCFNLNANDSVSTVNDHARRRGKACQDLVQADVTVSEEAGSRIIHLFEAARVYLSGSHEGQTP